jgi:hypothetical protein
MFYAIALNSYPRFESFEFDASYASQLKTQSKWNVNLMFNIDNFNEVSILSVVSMLTLLNALSLPQKSLKFLVFYSNVNLNSLPKC